MPAKSALELKGIREGLMVYLDAEEEWNGLVKELSILIDRQADFFKGARLALDVGSRLLHKQQLVILQNVLMGRGVTLWAVVSSNDATEAVVNAMDLQTTLEGTEPARQPEAVEQQAVPPAASDGRNHDVAQDEPPPIDSEEAGTAGIVVKRTLRSGRTVRYDGHVIVLGDVNPGAQIVAGGDVIVWGRLRGTVHAGAHGDETAQVCALDMIPMQLRIAGYIATSPPGKKRQPKPEVAIVRENRIVVESWH